MLWALNSHLPFYIQFTAFHEALASVWKLFSQCEHSVLWTLTTSTMLFINKAHNLFTRINDVSLVFLHGDRDFVQCILQGLSQLQCLGGNRVLTGQDTLLLQQPDVTIFPGGTLLIPSLTFSFPQVFPRSRYLGKKGREVCDICASTVPRSTLVVCSRRKGRGQRTPQLSVRKLAQSSFHMCEVSAA